MFYRMGGNQGIIFRAMAWLLGANWQTTITGGLALISGVIHVHPEHINWIPEPWRGIIWSWSELIFYCSAGTFVYFAKAKGVTGGVIQQTLGGNLAKPGEQALVDATKKASPPEEQAKVPDIKP